VRKTELENALLVFSYKEENQETAEAAFVKFYKTFSKYLKVVVSNAKKPWGNIDDDIVEIVVNETLLKIYNAPPLNFKILDTESDNDVINKFKGYLSTTAKRIFLGLISKGDYLKQERLKVEKSKSEEVTEINFELPKFIINNKIELSTYQRTLQEVLNTFSSRDRDILLTIYQYEEEGKKRPKEVIRELELLHQTTSQNIRKIKERREKDIIKYFETHSDLKPVETDK